MKLDLIKTKQYANQFYYMLEKGAPVGMVKRKLYDDHEEHLRLGLGEKTLDHIWTALMDKTFDPKAETRIGRARDRKDDGTMAKQVIQFDPVGNETIATYSSAKECAEKTGISYGVITNILYGIVANPKIHIRYAETSTLTESEKPKKPKKVKVEKAKAKPEPKVKKAPEPTLGEQVTSMNYVDSQIVPKAVLHIESPVNLTVEEARAVYIAALKAEVGKRIAELETYLVKTEIAILKH